MRKARASSEAPVVTKPVANTPRIFKHVSCAQRTSFTIYVRTRAENMLEQGNINHGESITGKPRSIRVPESPGLKGTFTLPHFHPRDSSGDENCPSTCRRCEESRGGGG